MKRFILPVVSPLRALWNGPTMAWIKRFIVAWFLQKVIGIIFTDRNKHPPPQTPPSHSYSPSDSPYEPRVVPSQEPYHSYPPNPVPSQYSTANQAPAQHPYDPPYHQPSTVYPTPPPPRNAPVRSSYTQQPPRPQSQTHPLNAWPTQQPPRPQPQTLSPNVWPTPSQDHRPRNLKDHHDTNKPTFEAQIPPDRPQSQHDRPLYQDLNQSNQHNEHYMSLRARANREGDEMAKCFQQSHEAYERREGALAKELSEKRKQHGRTMEALNTEASAWIFRENNLDSKPGELDLHGLYVKEAISYSEKGIEEARQRGDLQIRLIVGKGLHSNGDAKIKPALEDWMRQHNLPTEVDLQNKGVLIVQLA